MPPSLKRLSRNMHYAATRMQELLTDLTDSHRGNLAPPEIESLREIILATCKTAHSVPSENVRSFMDVPMGLSSALEAILHPASFRQFAA
jgi:hypothetical protein